MTRYIVLPTLFAFALGLGAAIGGAIGYAKGQQKAAAESEALGTFERLGHDVLQNVLQPPAAKPECNSLCQAMTASVLLHRSEGPLAHDCQFFKDCACDYQCPAATP